MSDCAWWKSNENQIQVSFSGNKRESDKTFKKITDKIDTYLTENNIQATLNKTDALSKEYLQKLVASNESGKKGSIVVVAEGVAKADEILAKIKKHTKLEGRAMSLEYVQRGGAPTARDRVLGSQFGLRAIELLLKGKSGVLLGVEDDKIFDMEIEEALGKAKSLDLDKYRLTDIISI